MTTDELLRELFRAATGPAAVVDPATLREAGPVKVTVGAAQRIATPSGKLEFYSERLAAQGLPAMPDWVPDPDEESEARRWPLRLLTAPGFHQSHTAFSGMATLRAREGQQVCLLHPQEAAGRGLSDGDRVQLYNDRAAIGLLVRVSDQAPPGVALVPGQRPASETLAGTVNMLCSDRYSDLGAGATYQSTRLEVRRLE